MKKWIVAFLSFCMLLRIAACGAEKTENIPMPENKSEEPAANVETTPVTEAGAEKPEDSSTDQSGSNILIAYFTWAENTQVETPKEVEADMVFFCSLFSVLYFENKVHCSSVNSAGPFPSEKNCDKVIPNALHTVSKVGNADTLFLLNIFVTVKWERPDSFAKR